ncbi:helix-turn-helix transcriptional regulator [Clostridium saccharoperbutylacetonicum]|uniref:helix-turn-helix transcriptional regulator n=1 Tax=Clostridium saccharoperbutylacetonicum TaxID=36745 RepID=UPI0039E7B407
MNNRLKELRKHLGLSQKEFGERIFVDQTHISSLESGRRDIPIRLIKDICSTFGVSEEWLRTGKGDMLIDIISGLDVDDEIKEMIRKMMALNPDDRTKIVKIVDSFLSE